MNPAFLCDGYKLGHRGMFPKGMTRMLSNWTPRESRVEGQREVVFFGLQFYLDRYLTEVFARFFAAPVETVVTEYARRINGYLGPNTIGTDHIRALHALGYLPLEFRAFPEGSRVPLRVPMLTVENTHPDFAWLVNYLESIMSCVLWLPCTSATTAMRIRALLDKAAETTGSPAAFVDWQGHDFSFRGMQGPEAAAISGAGHLLFFNGTDTLPSLDLIERHYGPIAADYLLAGSVPATEHSVMCAGGSQTERETFERLLELHPSGIVSIVSDTWDLWKVLTETLPSLKDQILARTGKLVIRPDSGNPADIACGNPAAPEGSPARKGVIELLWDVFGGTGTATGHRLLDGHVGCIYGDAITYERAKEITERLAAKGFASGNMVFGIGSFSYQYVTRDTYGFAMKATWAEIDGVGVDLWKKPITDNGTKNSARGRLAVLAGEDGVPMLVNRATPEQEAASALRPVWRDGKFLARETFDVIRERARKG